MNTERINLSSIVRSILLIAIGIILGIGISIISGIGRIGIAPSSISQGVGQLDRQVAVGDLGSSVATFDVSARQVSMVAQPDVVALVRKTAEVVELAL
jgi:hypothetical protein